MLLENNILKKNVLGGKKLFQSCSVSRDSVGRTQMQTTPGNWNRKLFISNNEQKKNGRLVLKKETELSYRFGQRYRQQRQNR